MEGRATILVVEGDISFRHPLAEYLRGCGFKVREASNGQEAQQALQSDYHRPDVVLADMATEGSGFLLAHWIRENEIDVEVVMAGSPEKVVEHAENLCAEGADLSKPYEHEVVLQRIRQMLQRRERNSGNARAN